MNVLINSENILDTDAELVFGDEEIQLSDAKDLPELLVELGIYKSKSKARQAGRVGEIPPGYTAAFKASKKVELFIWNPTSREF